MCIGYSYGYVTLIFKSDSDSLKIKAQQAFHEIRAQNDTPANVFEYSGFTVHKSIGNVRFDDKLLQVELEAVDASDKTILINRYIIVNEAR